MKEETKKRRHMGGFVVQAGILAVAGIIVRIIGILYRAPLTQIIGDEGNGYYTHAYNIYAIILLISSYSIPSAMSKVVSGYLATGENKNAMRIVQCSLYYVLVVGGLASVMTYFIAPYVVEGSSVPVLRIFVPTIFLSGILGVSRGFFQSFKTMLPTSISQIVEQILNAVVSIGAAWLLIHFATGKDATTIAMRGAMGSALGTGSGVLIALIYTTSVFFRYRSDIVRAMGPGKEDEKIMSMKECFSVILHVVTPFILSTFIYNFSTSLNQTIYSKVMKHMYQLSASQIAINYGIFAGKAVVIANIPIAISSAMSSAVIPSISGAYARGDQERAKRQIATAVKVTMMIAIPCAIGLTALAEPVTRLLFPQKMSLELASNLLRSICVTVVFYALSTLTNAVLQAIGKVNTPVRHAAAALIVQTIVLVVLLCFTNLGLYALSISMILYSLLMCILNQIAVRRSLGYKQEIYRTFVVPIYAALLMGTFAHAAYRVVYDLAGSNILALFFAIAVGVGIYVILILRRGGITEEELLAVPKGDKVVRVLKKTKLLQDPRQRWEENKKKFQEKAEKQMKKMRKKQEK